MAIETHALRVTHVLGQSGFSVHFHHPPVLAPATAYDLECKNIYLLLFKKYIYWALGIFGHTQLCAMFFMDSYLPGGFIHRWHTYPLPRSLKATLVNCSSKPFMRVAHTCNWWADTLKPPAGDTYSSTWPWSHVAAISSTSVLHYRFAFNFSCRSSMTGEMQHEWQLWSKMLNKFFVS